MVDLSAFSLLDTLTSNIFNYNYLNHLFLWAIAISHQLYELIDHGADHGVSDCGWMKATCQKTKNKKVCTNLCCMLVEFFNFCIDVKRHSHYSASKKLLRYQYKPSFKQNLSLWNWDHFIQRFSFALVLRIFANQTACQWTMEVWQTNHPSLVERPCTDFIVPSLNIVNINVTITEH